MKHTKRTLTLLLTAAMLSTCLLPMAGCKNTATDDPLDVVLPSGDDKGSNDDFFKDTPSNNGYDPNADHGVHNLYGYYARPRYLFNEDMIIDIGNQITYFSTDKPTERYKLCFDPICEHANFNINEGCQASLNLYYPAPTPQGQPIPTYPMSAHLDYYDHADAPVLYLSYKRGSSYEINGVYQEREPDYCIQRYDFTQGTRTTVADGIMSTIHSMFTCGDYIYCITAEAGKVGGEQTLCRIPKTGGEFEEMPKTSDEDLTYTILEVYNDQLYYLLNTRYLYRCNLDFTNSELILDVATLKGTQSEKSNGIVEGVHNGYLYYHADIQMNNYGVEYGNFYRVPINDLAAAPELIAENMIYAPQKSIFNDSEDTFYYQPAVFEESDPSPDANPNEYYTDTTESNGTLFAVDLKTLEKTTVCEDIGMNITISTAFDDKVIFAGVMYDSKGALLANNGNNYIIGNKNGDKPKVWFSNAQITQMN